MIRASVTFLLILLASSARAADPPVDFGRDVLPILSDNCYQCHGPDTKARKADLRLDVKGSALEVVVPGKPAESELIRRITSADPDTVMPPPRIKRKLSPQQIDTLRRWVEQGAKWGKHWAFEPMLRPATPVGRNPKASAWVKNPIDAFVLDRLEREDLSPAPPADKERLLRRVTLDLTGLPPTLAELDNFLADDAPEAYEKVVDRLLASPRYGERMASEWLALARYADTHGYQMDRYRAVWPYRDWVISAFNRNLPFDQFVTWQLAG
ncbi:MAG TPA: DUF1549 domain-containing protein, partial [Gemmataceae bacterium]|nr:DUF1549 domain-containing protein [Gemmataceae bacterium]